MLHVNFEVDPTHEFKNELMCIRNPFYLNLVVGALHKVPDYFWVVPASSSGKYHPKSSLGIAGLVRHVKSVFWVSEELLSHPLYAPFTEDEKDEIRVAILLHDCAKQGIENNGSHTVVEHPLLVREHLNPVEDDTVDGKYSKAWSRICDLIETHMGIWNKDRHGNDILDIPKTKAQLFVHMCDYLASRKIIEVDTTQRDPQANYGNKSEPTWKSDPATQGQIDYIKKLYVIVSERGLDTPPVKITDENGKVILTKGYATGKINQLKELLGIK